MAVPSGATHYDDSDGTIVFYKLRDDYYGRYQWWYWWDGSRWMKDDAISSWLFKPISEYISDI